eukprot:CAMPEP_0170590268 /NCGR_PEP_ID=MMETSP0224-20130122/11779_1 /TAXON_ID=285029 /ORGANISM="Togula jolla, Strain CCCM 725" /LENGTH=161 /DNA_ID=CAMNT_0010914053 /DNA_START=89 /DNA_END=574 /DNA_ORIENTATION=-
MVIKTDLCNYTEYRIYPGHGQKFVAKDGKVHFFITAKADSLFHQRIKPVKLRWTQAWRRMNKKGKVEEGAKKRTRKVAKFQKAIVGMTLDDIKKKKAQKPELRQAAKEAAAKEAKARAAQKPKAAAKASTKAAAKPKSQAKVPKGAAAGGGGAKKDFKGKK